MHGYTRQLVPNTLPSLCFLLIKDDWIGSFLWIYCDQQRNWRSLFKKTHALTGRFISKPDRGHCRQKGEKLNCVSPLSHKAEFYTRRERWESWLGLETIQDFRHDLAKVCFTCAVLPGGQTPRGRERKSSKQSPYPFSKSYILALMQSY